jgi:hypothetical protein
VCGFFGFLYKNDFPEDALDILHVMGDAIKAPGPVGLWSY